MKYFFLFVLLTNIISFSEAKEYILESHGKRLMVKEHYYSKKDNFRVFKLEGTFKDNAGNFGEFNSIVTASTMNNKIENLQASNEFLYGGNIKAYNIAKRSNNELKQGVGKWYYTYATESINSIVNSECIYSISYYKDKFLTIAKCNISKEAFEDIKNINKNK